MPKRKVLKNLDSDESNTTPKKQKNVPSCLMGSAMKNQESIMCSENVSPQKQIRNSQDKKDDDSIEEENLPIQDMKELERELELKAERNNLTARNVKEMIKAVITDTEVLKMVDYSLQKTEEKPTYELKLTRAKTKELVGLEQNVIFNMPVPPKKSDIEALITQELPEDSSDEEYEPHFESDDELESKASEAGGLDDEADLDTSVRTFASQDSFIRNGNIGQRTRSKLSLSETPLEAIEQAFIPPDITTDMYNTDCDNEDWLNFLKEFMQPLDTTHQEANDDENDPEYNVMMDEEKEAADKEELRADRAVKVSKKELNDLMSELFEYTQMLSSDDEEKDSSENKKTFDKAVEENKEAPVEKEIINDTDNITPLLPSQILLLKQQLQQHVQLVTQSCLLLCGFTDEYDTYYKECKARLNELNNIRKMNNENSFFAVLNLNSSLKLINDWEEIVMNSSESEGILKFLKEEQIKCYEQAKKKVRYLPQLPPRLIKICLQSDAFLYPLYLPASGFSTHVSQHKFFIDSELQLLAIGLEEFSTFLENNLEIQQDLIETIAYVHHYLVPAKDEIQILKKVKEILSSKKPSSVRDVITLKKPQYVDHFVFPNFELKVLSSYSIEFFHKNWQKYL